MIQFAVDAVDAADGASLIAQHYGIPQPEGRVATWCHHFTRFTSSTPVPRDTCWRAAYPQRVWADAPLRRSRRSLLHQSPDPRRQTGFIRLPICWYLTLFYMQKRVHMLCMICIHIRVRHVCVFAVWWSIFQYRGQVWGFTISIKTLQCGAFHVFSQKKPKARSSPSDDLPHDRIELISTNTSPILPILVISFSSHFPWGLVVFCNECIGRVLISLHRTLQRLSGAGTVHRGSGALKSALT